MITHILFDFDGMLVESMDLSLHEACRLASVKNIAVTWGCDPASLIESGRPDFIAGTPGDELETVLALRWEKLCGHDHT